MMLTGLLGRRCEDVGGKTRQNEDRRRRGYQSFFMSTPPVKEERRSRVSFDNAEKQLNVL